MFVVWGKKFVYRKVGYVADFCPICRTPKPFELKRVGLASHVYYISAGEGELAGHERTCRECGTSFQAEPTVYASISKLPAPLTQLAKQTYPHMNEVLRDRLALEETVQRAPSSLTSEQRYALIRSPFLLLSSKVEKRFASTHVDKEIGLSMVAALGLMFIGPSLVTAVALDSAELAILIFIALGLFLVTWQILGSGRRFMKRHLVSILAKSLRPLQPTERELRTVLAELKQLRHKIATKMKLADLQAHLRSDGEPRRMRVK